MPTSQRHHPTTRRRAELIAERLRAGDTAAVIGVVVGLSANQVRQTCIETLGGSVYDEALAQGRIHRRPFTHQACLAALRRVHAGLGDGPLSHGAYDRARTAREPSASLVMCRFGGWTVACAAAGVPANHTTGQHRRPQRWSDEQLRQALRRFAAAQDRRRAASVLLKMSAYTRWANAQGESQPSVGAIRYRFGTWQAAKDAALGQGLARTNAA